MKLNVAKEVAALQRLTMHELRGRYAELFGEATVTGNRQWLVRRIAWRMQALAEGGLSDRALRRATELANDADLRLAPPRTPQAATAAPRRSRKDEPQRLAPGTILRRPYKGETLQVKVLADGFEFEGTTYSSLSAVAKAITGSHTSGFLFFRLNAQGGGQ
jgi:Protein of unknown function (DUF2924)